MPSVRPAEVCAAAAAACALAGAACANEAPPPGALPDARPPEVTEIKPAPDSVVPGFRGEVQVSFNEPVNVGRRIATDLIASPAGRYGVKAGFSDLKIRPRDGWLVAVYCFVLPEGITDLLRNRTESTIDFCFSTGPPVTSTLVTGQLIDRVTGRPVRGARVLFLALPADSTPYSAVADAEGNFSLRALPPGEYSAFGFMDQNANFRLDPALEPSDSSGFRLEGPTATASISLSILEPDSTPPLLVSAEVADSLTVELKFDDVLPRSEPAPGEVAISDEETDRPIAIRLVRIGPPAEVPDSLRSLPVAPVEAEPAPAEAEAAAVEAEMRAAPAELGAPAPQTPPREPEAEALPSQSITVLLAEPLRPATYRVRAAGFINLRGLVGGGDTTFVYAPPDSTEQPEGRGSRR